MCGLHPLAVALEALYGSGGDGLCCQRPRLLDYRPAHAIFPRPDSTGFAALVVRQQLASVNVTATAVEEGTPDVAVVAS
jgi:hypothetical protein